MRPPKSALTVASIAVVVFVAFPAAAQEAVAPEVSSGLSLEWLVTLGALAVVPLALAMLTAFVKVVVVLGILRSALGLQSVPPLPLVLGLAVVLTAVIMAPVGMAMVEEAQGALDQTPAGVSESQTDWARVSAASAAALGPLVTFLGEHAHPSEVSLFAELSGRDAAAADPLVLAPAFVISELKEAFMIGFLLFVPFLVIDLVVANVLMSLGMHMLSPTTVSLPFKLLLFVMVDGWHLLAQGLITSYQIV